MTATSLLRIPRQAANRIACSSVNSKYVVASIVLALAIFGNHGNGESLGQETLPTPSMDDVAPDEALHRDRSDVEEVLPPQLGTQSHGEVHRCERVQALIDEIAAERERLIHEQALALQQRATINRKLPAVPPNVAPNGVPEIEKRLADWERTHAARLSQLRRKIEQLHVLLAQQSPPQVAEPPPLIVETPTPEAPAPNPQQAPPPVEPPPNVAVVPPAAEKMLFPQEGSPLPVTNAPVDRVALANNLFGAGRYALALEIYENVAAENGDNWIRYQIACCHRQSGNLSNAEKNYRVIAAAEDTPFLAEKARWWLDIMDKRREATETLERLQATLESLQSGDEK